MNNGSGISETPNFQTSFKPGQKAYFAVYLRDQQAEQQIDLKIYRPDGTVWATWNCEMNSPFHYAASRWYLWLILPADPQEGQCRWNVRFEGQEAESEFAVVDKVFSDGFEDPGPVDMTVTAM